MKKIEPIIINTERLCLRPFELSDAPAMYQNWASDPEVTRYLTWPTHASEEVTRTLLALWIEQRDPSWCVALRETNEAIGSISVVSANVETQTVEIGYCLSRAYWGGGLMPEAASALIETLFHTFEVKRVIAKHDSENLKSGRVMQKAGMRYVGRREKGAQNNLGLRDMELYEIVRGGDSA
ncbi:MAG: GNAT family N-acetyltransferase [Clostridia bacterium]|nr:GNAT family N-acetyltransferase [Clostridia bacterium]